MRFYRLPPARLVAVLVTLAFAAACGGDDPDPDPTPTATQPPPATTTTPTTTTTPATTATPTTTEPPQTPTAETGSADGPYLRALCTAGDELQDAILSAAVRLETESVDPDDPEAFAELFVAPLGAFLEAIRGVTPPADLAEYHAAALAGYESFIEVFGSLEESGSPDEAMSLLGGGLGAAEDAPAISPETIARLARVASDIPECAGSPFLESFLGQGAAPAATATPATPEARERLSMRDFVLDESTTGQDLVDRLSEEEAACIKTALGETAYQFLLALPLMTAAAGDSGGSADPIFDCLTVENVVLVGFAFSDATAGFQDPQGRECIQDLALDHPAIFYERLGLEWEGEAADPGDIKDFIVRLNQCLTDEERVAYLVSLFDRLAAASPYLGSDLVALLPESEVACVMDELAGEYQAFLASNLERGFGVGLHDCFSDETHVRMFLETTQARVGGFSAETNACLADFAREHVHFVEISTTLDPAALTPAEFAEIARDGLLMLECMNEEELVRMQGVGVQSGLQ